MVQFPHTGSRDPIDGRNPNSILLRDFLKSSKSLLSYGGKVIVSIVDSPYYQGAFDLQNLFSGLYAASPSACQIEDADTEAKYKRYTIYNLFIVFTIKYFKKLKSDYYDTLKDYSAYKKYLEDENVDWQRTIKDWCRDFITDNKIKLNISKTKKKKYGQYED